MPQFEDGNAGGPGRPKGRLNDVTKIRQLLDDGLVEQAKQVLRQALDRGSESAAKFVLKHALGTPKGAKVQLDLPDVETAEDARRAQNEVLQAVAHGEIATGDAEAVCRMIDGQRRAIEAEVLEEKIDQHEKALAEDYDFRKALVDAAIAKKCALQAAAASPG